MEYDYLYVLEFLRKDCVNVNDFFLKYSVVVMIVWEFFEFVIDLFIIYENMDVYFLKVMEIVF